MSLTWGESPLCYQRLTRAELSAVGAIELEPEQLSRFLGPVEAILSAVENGPAHSLVAISAAGALVGFYVVHPDLRDGSCWWLGWLALDRRNQGCGYGRLALAAALARMRSLPECRRIRLLVAPENTRARHLYACAGFAQVGVFASTGELVLELDVASATFEDSNQTFLLQAVAAKTRRVFRHRRLRLTVGPHAAWVIGVERGPPALRRRVDKGWRPAQAAPCRRTLPRAKALRLA